MTQVMSIISMAFDALLAPFGAAQVWGVAFLSLITAVFVLFVYGLISRQDEIKRIKKMVQGHFLGIYLFRDFPGQILLSLCGVLANSLRYILYSLPPLAVILIPILIACVQMQLRYGHENLRPGQSVMVSASLDSAESLNAVQLGLSPGLAPEAPPIRIGDKLEVDWRIRVMESGEQYLIVTADGSCVRKAVGVGNGIQRLYPATERGSLMGSLLRPGDEPISGGSPVRAVRVDYPPARMCVAGLRVHWAVVYFVLTIALGLVLKGFFGVEF